MMYVTTSWDDGHTLDTRLADLLDAYKVKGTFYLSKQYPDIGKLLSEGDIKKLSEKHEVGAHTLTHPDLTALDEANIRSELAGSKQWLETVTGREVSVFCYPSGKYTATAARLAQEVGFKGARTIYWPSIYFPTEPYEMPTTLPVYPLPFRKLAGGRYWWRKLLQPLFERYKRLRALGVPLWRMYSWDSAARSAFDYAYKNGNTFHLWGHSWELENYGLWKELEDVLAYIASKPDVRFVTNSELLEIVQKKVQVLGEDGYGSWAMSPEGLTTQSIVYSFGVGEDASWDTALAQKYGLHVHAFDPTPKSIAWMHSQHMSKELTFHEYGVAAKDGVTTFYPPLKSGNVSYTPFNLSGAGEAVHLPVKRLKTIMEELGHDSIDVLKMDIEGFEYDVIEDMLASSIFPLQLLVEFHHRRREIGMARTQKAIKSLTRHGYRILNVSRGGDKYSFIKV